ADVGDRDRSLGADQAVRVLGKYQRVLGDIHERFGDVFPVVGAEAQNLVRIRDRRAEGASTPPPRGRDSPPARAPPERKRVVGPPPSGLEDRADAFLATVELPSGGNQVDDVLADLDRRLPAIKPVRDQPLQPDSPSPRLRRYVTVPS